MKADFYKPVRVSLGVWLVDTWMKFQKEHPEAFEGDVDDWVMMSPNHITLAGPETRYLTPHEWPARAFL